jgi:hypothetical protein
MDLYAQMAVKIIQSQEAIIGPVAIEQAKQVSGLEVDWAHHEVSIQGEARRTINNLITVYQELFGQISVEVSKEAASGLTGQLTADQVPEALK